MESSSVFNIEQLIQAAEYLDRRERGKKKYLIVFVFRHVIWKCLNFDSSETKNGDHLCSNFQKLSMAMHRLHLCLNFYQIKRSRNQRNLREIGEWKFFFRFVDYEVFTCIPRVLVYHEVVAILKSADIGSTLYCRYYETIQPIILINDYIAYLNIN